ncbi:MAG: transketolase [Bacteroidales bacterium]|jgi:transketolase|nr:transketolase [Bacteroidales bacterium]
MKDIELQKLEDKAKEIRKMTIDEIGFLGVGHIGGALSVVEVLTILYYKYMDVSPKQPGKKDRDKLVLSKGHAGPTLYSVLADKGFFPEEWLHTLNHGGTNLPSHCDMNRTPGIDMTTGSLGQGISAAIGIALGNRLDKIDKNVYLIIGDGESHEGQIWEGAMAAAHYNLNKLIAFTDNNKMGIDGYTYKTMNLEDLTSKWQSFGWFVQRIDGHNFKELETAIDRAREERFRPSMIVLDTIKGKGAFFAEGDLGNHNMKFDYETALKACQLLG